MKNVIFDTNAYLDIVEPVQQQDLDHFMGELLDKEKQADFEALMHPVVLKEILSHLYNNNNITRRELYLKANKAIYTHGLIKGSDTCRIIPSIELQLAKCLWGKELPKSIETSKALLQVSLAFFQSFPNLPSCLPKNLPLIYDGVEKGEKEFVTSITQFLKGIDASFNGVKMFASDRKKRQEMQKSLEQPDIEISIAKAFVVITEMLLYNQKVITGLDSEEQIKSKALILIRNFPEVIELQKWIYKQCFSANGFNVQKNRNFVWDIHLMFCAGNHTCAGNELFFVTSDKAMLRAVQSINKLNQKVLDIKQYKDMVGIQ